MQINNRQQLLAIAAVVVVALFAGDKLLFTPLKDAWTARADQIHALRKQVEDGQGMIQREASIRRRWDNLRTNALPNDASLAEERLLKAIENWSQDSRIAINSMAPQMKRDAEDYASLECRVDATGTLPAISRFLYDIERDSMALRVETLEISSRDSDGQQLTLALQLSGLVLNPTSQ